MVCFHANETDIYVIESLFLVMTNKRCKTWHTNQSNQSGLSCSHAFSKFCEMG